jgi:predicted RNase H-like HicB family nuclease
VEEAMITSKQSRYEVTIRWSDEDNAFIASIPKLTGCMAHGFSRYGALSALSLAESEWMKCAHEENWTIPTP